MTIYKVLVRDADGSTRLVERTGSLHRANVVYNDVRLSLLAALPTSKPVFVTEQVSDAKPQPAC